MPRQYVIETKNLTKIYEDNVIALNRVNLRIKRGIFCVMGPNGAGKTTLVRILSTLLLPTTGKAYVLGYDVIQEAKKLRKKIAILPQEARPISEATPWEHIYFYLFARGFSISDAKKEPSRFSRFSTYGT